ncbi:ribosomal L28 family-domain-containing protein [Xylariaceae sp. FL1272]|nr:ribosomal L28 family-domain-containing protein [Xylariaceae sp. FL1272]
MTPQLATTPLRCLRTQIPSATRCLSTTAPQFRQTPSHLTVPKDQLPDYPYGRFHAYKQANEGLFGGAKIRFGNTVAKKYKNKSRTTWLPNKHRKRLWSPALGAFIRTRMTAHVLHTIDRLGGIDEYLLGSKSRRIRELGPAGWALRWKIMQTPAVQSRFAAERAALGLPPKGDATAVAELDLPEELAADGLTSEGVLSAVDGMIQRDEEFDLGQPETEQEAVAAAPKETSFMAEEPAPKPKKINVKRSWKTE